MRVSEFIFLLGEGQQILSPNWLNVVVYKYPLVPLLILAQCRVEEQFSRPRSRATYKYAFIFPFSIPLLFVYLHSTLNSLMNTTQGKVSTSIAGGNNIQLFRHYSTGKGPQQIFPEPEPGKWGSEQNTWGKYGQNWSKYGQNWSKWGPGPNANGPNWSYWYAGRPAGMRRPFLKGMLVGGGIVWLCSRRHHHHHHNC
eukprot:Phypoly_transcript_15461.p1 GENE.Phypoly_transcript_15461~~Phypoly_transcript_15461.p1  ORF type:complete len:197 (-),score=8.30 Phypoly_transcript_15461:123-713(-)